MRRPPSDEQVAQAMRTCIDEMKGVIAITTLEPGDDIDKWLTTCTRENFKRYFDLWENSQEKVLEASRAIGRIAEMLAVLDGSGQIGKAHVRHAINAVREHCLVGPERRALCPTEEQMNI